MEKAIKIFIGFIVSLVFIRFNESDVPSLLSSGALTDFLSVLLNVIGFVLMFWTGYLIISDLVRIARKR